MYRSKYLFQFLRLEYTSALENGYIGDLED